MGTPLPVVSGRDTAHALEKFGFELLPKRGKGSHIVMSKRGYPAIITIPDHRELDRGTLRSIIRSAGMTVEQFADLVRG